MEERLWWKNKDSFEAIRDQILFRGILKSKPEHGGVTNLSVVLQPSFFPVDCFKLGVRLQPHFNIVLDVISRDESFMKETFIRIAANDEFISSLYDIYLEVQRQGSVQTTTFGIHRSDYLVDVKKSHESGNADLTLKQVEINTISSGLVGHGYLVSELHKYVIERYEPELYRNQGKCIDNESVSKVADAMAVAHNEYKKTNAHVLFLVQSVEWNKFDQRHIEFELWKRHSIPVIRTTLSDIADRGKLTKERELFMDGIEISVIYYRAGYSPKEYPTQKEWDARRMMELSRASNCPSIAYQLVGCKKVQQLMCEEGLLEKYCTDSEIIRELRSTFTHQYSLEQTPKGDAVIDMVLKNPELYVLKPQREGGGNNLYGQELASSLSVMKSSSQREAYIVMEYINSPSYSSVVLKADDSQVTESNLISEIGFFGVFVRRGDDILLNDDAGHLLRSKPCDVKEGGVSVGVAAVDSPFLVTSDVYVQNVNI